MSNTYDIFSFIKNKVNKYSEYIVFIFLFFFFCILFFIFSSFFNKKTFDYTNLLKDKNYDIVYSLTNDIVEPKDMVPVINIDHPNVDLINSDIIKLYQSYLTKFTEKFYYDFSVSNNILSILISSKQRYVDASNYDIQYKTYNLNLETLELISDKELLQIFDIEEKEMRYFITYKFINYYKDLINNNYFTKEECDFDCFIESKQITDFMSDNYYYVNNGNLELYKSFNIYSEFDEENYFNEDSFRFIVKQR